MCVWMNIFLLSSWYNWIEHRRCCCMWNTFQWTISWPLKFICFCCCCFLKKNRIEILSAFCFCVTVVWYEWKNVCELWCFNHIHCILKKSKEKRKRKYSIPVNINCQGFLFILIIRFLASHTHTDLMTIFFCSNVCLFCSLFTDTFFVTGKKMPCIGLIIILFHQQPSSVNQKKNMILYDGMTFSTNKKNAQACFDFSFITQFFLPESYQPNADDNVVGNALIRLQISLLLVLVRSSMHP